MYKNRYYELSFDPAKNQIFWKITGFWPSASVVPDLEKEWDAILAQAKPGFKMLADMTEMQAPDPDSDVEKLNLGLQRKVMEGGLGKLATIVSKSAVAGLAGRRTGEQSGIIKLARNFDNRAEAQAWLDSK